MALRMGVWAPEGTDLGEVPGSPAAAILTERPPATALNADAPAFRPWLPPQVVTLTSAARERARRARLGQGFTLLLECYAAGDRLLTLPEFVEARVVRVHTNLRAYPVRLAALQAGKQLVFARHLQDVFLVDAAEIPAIGFEYAASGKGMVRFGKRLDVDAKVQVDVFLSASYAVDLASGLRVSPCKMREELEFALLAEMKLVGNDTTVVTITETAGLVQGLALEEVSLGAQLPAYIICTWNGTTRIPRRRSRLKGIDWSKLSRRTLHASPLLLELRMRALGHIAPLE